MNLYTLLEEHIYNRLSILAPTILVDKLPEKKADYTTPTEKPRVSVGFEYSTFKEDETIGLQAQTEDLYFTVEIQARTLRTAHIGVYAIATKVRELLLGYQSITMPYNIFEKVLCKEFGNTPNPEYQNGLFTFTFRFMTKVIVQEIYIEPNAPLLNEVIGINDFGIENSTIQFEIE